MDPDDAKCPFCRVPVPTSDEEIVEMNNKRVEMDDAEGIRNLGCCYFNGRRGLPQDMDKALELWHRAGELGNTTAYCNMGYVYDRGRGVERDMRKAKHYYELAAIGGEPVARHYLGIREERAGNMSRSLKHYMIAARCGHVLSLKKIREFYMSGYATKDDYAKALRTHQKFVDGIKSAQRDDAALFDNDMYRYY